MNPRPTFHPTCIPYGSHSASGMPAISALRAGHRVGWPWIVSCWSDPCQAMTAPPSGIRIQIGSAR